MGRSSDADHLMLLTVFGYFGILLATQSTSPRLKSSPTSKFITACTTGHLPTVQHLAPSLFNSHHHGFLLACSNGHLEVVQHLLVSPTDVRFWEEAPLRAAAIGGHFEVLKALVARRSGMHYVISNSSLKLAAIMASNFEVFEVLFFHLAQKSKRAARLLDCILFYALHHGHAASISSILLWDQLRQRISLRTRIKTISNGMAIAVELKSRQLVYSLLHVILSSDYNDCDGINMKRTGQELVLDLRKSYRVFRELRLFSIINISHLPVEICFHIACFVCIELNQLST